MDLFFTMIVFLTLITLWTGLVTPVEIKIQQVDWRNLLLDSASIECRCEDMVGQASHVTSLKISGADDTILASLDATDGLNPSNTDVMGEIASDIRHTNLKLIIPELYAGHSGTYSCTVGYVATDGSTQEDVARRALHVRKQDINQIVQSIGSNVWALQKDVFELNEVKESLRSEDRCREDVTKDLQEIVRRQDEAINTQMQVIQDLQEKVQVCAFTANYDDKDKLNVGDVLIFGLVRVNICNAYSPTTGVFTAPQSGLYSFSLTITTENSGNLVSVLIFVNDQDVGKVYAKDTAAPGDQTSMTLALRLRVFPKVDDTNVDALEDYDYYSVFSGYLINTL